MTSGTDGGVRRPTARLCATLLVCLVAVAGVLAADPAHAQTDTTPLWSATMTVGDFSSGSRGFHSGQDGQLSDNTFDVSGTERRVLELSRRASGWGNRIHLRFSFDLTNAQVASWVVEVAGHKLPLSSASDHNTEFRWSSTWLDSNVPALNLDNYKTTLPEDGTVRVCLRENDDQLCPGGDTTTTTNDATLSDLALTDGDGNAVTLDPAFDSATETYTAAVPMAVDQVTVAATVNDDGASDPVYENNGAAIDDADGGDMNGFQIDLGLGANVIKATVTAENGTDTKTYQVTLTRALTDVCERTPQVRDAIVDLVSGIDNCAYLTSSHLAGITGRLSLRNEGLTSLKVGDFGGLTALSELALDFNSLEQLPAGIFDELEALTLLELGFNDLEQLPAGIFDELEALLVLDLENNDLEVLPAGIFDELEALQRLWMKDNELERLPAGIFDNLTALTWLDLEGNELADLPNDVFVRLTALTTLYLQGNSGAPFNPVADAGTDRSAATGASVTLAGEATGAWGDNVTWAWVQVDGDGSDTEVTGGPTLSGADSATPAFQAPGSAATLYFRATATPVPDADGTEGKASDADWVKVEVTTTTITAPTVSSVAVTSMPSTTTNDYNTGDKIEFTVTFSAAVEVTGEPHFEFSLGPDGDATDKEAAYESGSGTAALVFAYTVQAGDWDDNGIWIGNQNRTLKLDTGEFIRAVGTTTDANLNHSALGTRPGHKVHGRSDATGMPSITGTPQVGQTLTADDGDIDDANGLPTTTFPDGYEFQWYRVDSGTDTEITGATSQTYNPTGADVGMELKVEVSFDDRRDTMEARRSLATPRVRPEAQSCSARTGAAWCTTLTVERSDSSGGTAYGYRRSTYGSIVSGRSPSAGPPTRSSASCCGMATTPRARRRSSPGPTSFRTGGRST